MKTILLVEDETLIALAEAKALKDLGYEVLTIGSGEKAVELTLKDAGIDLILMDIDLGKGIDGTEAARRILSARNLPIIFLTSHFERGVVERVRGITRYGYVSKTTSDLVLQSHIEMAFELFETHERLRASEARLKTVFKTIPDLIWLKDAKGAYLAFNPLFEQYMGRSEAELLGKTDFDFFEKETAEFFHKHDRRALESGKARTNEEWVTFKNDGHKVLLETVKTPLTDETGQCVGVLGIGRDITERKLLEEALLESERKVKSKLEAITNPEGDIEALDLEEIVDIPTLTALMENFSALTGMVVAILDTKGKILLATGWQDICVKFHRGNPITAAHCTESDLYLADRTEPGEYVEYKCENGMWDIETPLYIESRHVGNIYSGQYFYDDDIVDTKWFAAQAERYGFDKKEYLEALGRVPRFTRAEITRLMDYLVRLTDFISRLSLANLRLARTTAEKGRTEELLSKSVTEKEMLLNELRHRVKNSLAIVSSLLSLKIPDLSDEPSRKIFEDAINRIHSISLIYEKLSGPSGYEGVNLSSYIQDLVELLGDTYTERAGQVRVTTDLDNVGCGLRQALPLGLILNELLTNAFKYAYPNGQSGEIRVTLKQDKPDLFLTVSDDGPGIPNGFDVENAPSLGLRIASLLAKEQGGELRFVQGEGTTALVCLRSE